MDTSKITTNKVEAFQFPSGEAKKNLDPYSHLNELLDAKLIVCIVQFKRLKFGVRHFFPLASGWLECVVDDEQLQDGDDIRIMIRQGLPMVLYVGQIPFTS